MVMMQMIQHASKCRFEMHADILMLRSISLRILSSICGNESRLLQGNMSADSRLSNAVCCERSLRKGLIRLIVTK
jgi:hypothetical protein